MFAAVVEAAAGLCDGKGECVTAVDVINPATEEVLRTVEQLDEAGVDDAVRTREGGTT